MTTAGYVAAQCPPAPTQAQCLHDAQKIPPEVIFVRAVAGPAGRAALWPITVAWRRATLPAP